MSYSTGENSLLSATSCREPCSHERVLSRAAAPLDCHKSYVQRQPSLILALNASPQTGDLLQQPELKKGTAGAELWQLAKPHNRDSQRNSISCTLQSSSACHSPGKERSRDCAISAGLDGKLGEGERPKLPRFCAAGCAGTRSHRVCATTGGWQVISMYILDVGVGTDDVLNFIRVGVLEGKGAGSHPEPFPVFGSESEHD